MLFVKGKKSLGFERSLKCGVLCLAMVFLTSAADAQNSKTRKINCDANNNKTINKLIKRSKRGDTILIRGTCIENVNLNKGITLDGRGTASIMPADPSVPTITVSARYATVKSLILDSVVENTQILVTDQSLVTIENNDIANADIYGISVYGASSASIIGNRIYGNADGILAVEASSLRVGFKSLAVNEVIPNVIENNINNGIIVARAFANISGNQIIGNGNIGVVITRNASARIAGNEISGHNIGIVNVNNSTTDLALTDDGEGLFGSPNFGVNSQLGLFCNSGFTSGFVGSDFGVVVVELPCESQLIFPALPVPVP